MHRRAFLMTATAGITVGSGCLSWTGLGDRIQTPEQVESLSFNITEEGGDPASPPRIAFEPAFRQVLVRITGTVGAGNPCKEAQLKTVDYESKTDELTVLVVVGEKPFTFGCPDSARTHTYEVVIAFDSRFPETVTATHRDVEGETATTAASPAG